jgi:hypothetical protein
LVIDGNPQLRAIIEVAGYKTGIQLVSVYRSRVGPYSGCGFDSNLDSNRRTKSFI